MKKVQITTSWDDGHVLDLKLAALLKQYGIAGTFYISPEDKEIPQEKRLGNKEIKELSNSFEIGAHTMTHPRLTELQDEAARTEIITSKKYLENITGKPIDSFCYPAGYYDLRHTRMLKDAGFKLGRTVKRFATSIGNNSLELPTSVHAYRHWSDAISILKAVGLRKFLKCYSNWDELAMHVFDSVLKNGGTFHLWGHSWEIDNNRDWQRLERVLSHIAAHRDAEYVTNGQLINELENSEKTVLFVTPYFLPHGGGLEHYAFEIATHLQKEYGWKVTVLTSGDRGNIDTVEVYNGLTVRRLGYQFKISNTPFSFRWFRKVESIIKDVNPTLINVHMPVPGIGDIAVRAAGAHPVVLTYHAGSMHKGHFLHDLVTGFYERLVLPLLLRRVNQIVCSSDFVRDGLLKKYNYKSTTIVPGVDVEVFKPNREKRSSQNTLLFVAGLGRSEQYKGLTTLLEAVRILRKKDVDIRLDVVGEGDMRPEYEEYVAKHNLQNVVLFRGRLTGIPLVEVYQQAYLFVLPTSNDSFAMTILEAMSTGLPVISTPIGSIPQIVEDSKTGFIVNPHDPVALAAKIEKLFADPALLERFGRAGRTKVERGFGWYERAALTNSLFEKTCLTSDMPNIVQITPYFPPHVGGLERVAEKIAQILASRDKEVLVLASDIHGVRGVKRERNLTVKRLWSFEFAHTPIAPTLLWHLFLLPKKSIIHFHLSQAYWPEFVLLISKIRKIPYIVHFHLDVEPSGRFGFLFRIYKKILWGPFLRNAQEVITFSHEQEAILNDKYKVTQHKIHIIPNGVGEEFFSLPENTSRNNRLELLYVGRLASQKRIDRLLEAMALLSVPAHLTIVGDGDERKNLEMTVKNLDLKNVSFTGFKSENEVRAFYKKSHTLLVSSEREGMPLTVLEAMAAGLPIVGSNVIGIRELVSGIGILIGEPYAEGFARTIEDLYKNPSRLEELAKLSYAKAKEFSWARLIERLEKLYDPISV